MGGRSLVAALGLSAVLFGAAITAARADSHLPIIDFTPTVTWAGAGNIQGNTVQSGEVQLNGTVTIPIYKGLTASYDRIADGVYANTFDRVAIPGLGYLQAGSYTDVVQQYHLNEQIKGFNIELGLSNRERSCCPGSSALSTASSTEWHQGYLGLTYVTPSFDFLNHGVFVLNVTGHTANHKPSPNDILNEQAQGTAASLDVGNVREYGTTQAATAVVPIGDPRSGLVGTGTYTWGTFDYFQNEPFPYAYGIWAFTATKHFTKEFSVELRQVNLWQRPQGSPFPAPNSIHVVDWSLLTEFHIDLNRVLKAH